MSSLTLIARSQASLTGKPHMVKRWSEDARMTFAAEKTILFGVGQALAPQVFFGMFRLSQSTQVQATVMLWLGMLRLN